MTRKRLPMKAWAEYGAADKVCAVHLGDRPREYHSTWYVEVVVRSSEEDAAREAEIRRLRRALRIAKSYEAGWHIAWGAGGVVDQYRTEHDLPDSGYLRTEDGRCACNVCVGVKRRWDEIARKGGAK